MPRSLLFLPATHRVPNLRCQLNVTPGARPPNLSGAGPHPTQTDVPLEAFLFNPHFVLYWFLDFCQPFALKQLVLALNLKKKKKSWYFEKYTSYTSLTSTMDWSRNISRFFLQILNRRGSSHFIREGWLVHVLTLSLEVHTLSWALVN